MNHTKNENPPLEPRFKIKKTRVGGERSAAGADDGGQNEFPPDKVIYVEIDEEITTVFDRIKRCKGEKIALVVPKQAVILQSIVNLRILKKKTDELTKQIAMVTTDVPGGQLAEKAGIFVVRKLFEKSVEPAAGTPAKIPPSAGQRPVRIAGKKLSIAEVVNKNRPDIWGAIFGKIKEHIKKKKQEASQTRLVFVTPNKQALFTLILVSVLLLLTIAYIALPGATVYLTPRSSILDPSFNVTFLDYERNRGILENNFQNAITIASFPVKPPPFTKKITYSATGKIFRGENAAGTITVINLSDSPWDLAARTRFQTEDGIVFRAPRPVRVPAAQNPSAPGTLEVFVTANEYDALGQVIGERGNIPPSRFFLPGLKNEENRRKLYAESKTPMTGGVTRTIKTASEEDIKAAAEFAKKEALRGAADDLKAYLEQQNLAKKQNLSLLTDRNLIKVSEPQVEVPVGAAGSQIERFEVTARYTAAGIAYDRQELVDALKERIMDRVDPDKKILRINEDDISYRFLDEDASAGRVRLTAAMRAVQIYELDPERENGRRFLKKITDHILGARVNEAVTYLRRQTDEIANVEIKTWPIWAPTIPNIADNIKFVIREEE